MAEGVSKTVNARLDILRAHGLLESGKRPEFDNVVLLAARLCDTPMASFSVNDASRQRFVSCHGFSLEYLPLGKGFAQHVVSGKALLLVNDTKNDPRFRDVPLARALPELRFFAGVPVTSPNGVAIGTLAVMDTVSRHLPEEKLSALATLADQLITHLELERRMRPRRDAGERADARVDFHALFDALPGIYCAIEPNEYRFVAVSEEFLHATMTRREDLIGKRLFEVFPGDPDDGNNGVHTLQASLERVKLLGRSDEVSLMRYPIARPAAKGGGFEERYWSAVSSPVYDAGKRLRYIMHNTEDVTEVVCLQAREGEASKGRHALELRAARLEADTLRHASELERLNEHLAMAQRVAHIGSWEYHIANGHRQWSDEVYQIMGLSRDEYPEGEEALLAAIHPDDYQMLAEERERTLKGEGPMEMIHRIVRPDGSIRHVQEKARLLRDDDGKPVMLYGTVQDITEQKLAEAEIEARARRQQAVARLGQHALTGASLDELRHETVTVAREMLDAEFSGLFELLPGGRELMLVAGAGWKEGAVGATVITVPKESRTAQALQSGRPVVIQDMRTDARWDTALLREHGIVSGIGGVIAGDHGPGGMLVVNSTLLREFNDAEVHFVQSLANVLAEATQRMQAGEELRMRARQQAAVAVLGREALRTTDLPRLEQLAAEQVAQTFGVEFCKVLELLPDGSGLKLVAGVGWKTGLVGHAILGFGGRSHGGYTLEANEPVIFEDLDRETRFRPPLMFREHNVVSGISVIIAGEDGQPWGVLGAHSIRHRIFTADDVNFIQNMANVLAEVTQRAHADATVRESEERFRIVARATADVIWDWNLLTDAIWWNDGMRTVFGYAPDEIEPDSSSWARRIHPDDKNRVLEDIHRAMDSDHDEWQNEYRFIRKDGSVAHVIDKGFVIRDDSGKAIRMVGGMDDVTEKKEYETRLRQHAALLDKAQDAIMVFGVDYRIRYWNRSAERLYGWSVAEALGRSVKDLLYDASAVFREAMKTLLHTGEWAGEIQQQRKDGGTITVEGAWTLVRDDDGEPQSVLAINTDMTERLALEEQLRQSQRLESIGKLTGGVAHDFNNLLTVILGNAELLTEQLGADPHLRTLAEMTRAAAQRGSELTHRLLAFARRQTLEPRVTDVNRLVADMQGLLQRALPENIGVEIVRNDALWKAMVDPAQLEATLLNLAINAKDAMPDGGDLTIEAENVSLDDDYAAHHAEVVPGRYVMIAVSDTGAGIPPEIMDRVFDPFFTTKEKGKGTGLGLSMAYGFTKQSRGHIKIYSEPGQGTTVKLYLPQAGQPEETASALELAATDISGSEKILLVEDDELVRRHAESQLAEFGYHVVAARNGPEALDIIRQETDIDLLLTDVVMSGGMNGRDLAEMAQRLRPRLKVLYTSGYTENAIVHQGRLDRGVHLLQKPYQRADLARKVRKVLSEGGRA